jgi:general transcription factor 3C polypeptide 3 (transcription factor C subunit 4)
MDLALVDDKLKKKMAGERGTYSAVDDKGGFIINEDMDLSLIMLYGHILFTGQSYSFALNYFFRAHALDPDNEVINLCIGLSYIHHGLKRQAENRQHNILQGTTFMFLYYESRKTSEHLEERQEAHYNMARVYHMLGLPHLALPYYQKVLDEVANGRHSEREDLVMDTAYNLQTMYSSVGNMELAREVTERWLVI